MVKAILIVCFSIGALLLWAHIHESSIKTVGGYLSPPPTRFETVDVNANDCPPWCAQGCVRVKRTFVKACR